ncbi:ATP-dependent RNA helicase glh-4 [Frankliniella fusca]|uniref:ATP-dependent RNA helicase glh-4 n=1 Tax=Frankliniella fusca TaxID=407009 RepID=A0AAE1HH36_9NEOP|nr:ATP-dependent RNA helicase glh-4 [Frankliniella fusca]
MVPPPAIQGVLMQKLGELEHFDPNGPNTFSQWVERFNIFCECNAIPLEPTDKEGRFFAESNRRRNLFLMMVGPRAYAILQRELCPVSPSNRQIPILVETLKEHYEPVGHIQANRFMFSHRLQQPNESVAEFISALTSIAATCGWDNWDDALMGQLLVGIRHQDTRAKLIDMKNATWLGMKTEALKDDKMRVQMRTFAQAHAQIQQRVMTVQKNPKSSGKKDTTVSPTAPKPGKPPAPAAGAPPAGAPPANPSSGGGRRFGPCHRCGRRHDARTCPSINLECRACHKKGHFAHRCPSKPVPVKLVSVPPEGDVPPEGELNEDLEQLVDHLLSF